MSTPEVLQPTAGGYRLSEAGEALQGRVRWWRVDIDLDQEPAAATLHDLSGEEREELGRWQRRADRARFAAVRSALRRVLAEAGGGTPAAVPIRRDRFGRPGLVAGGAGLDFNVSHAGEHGLIALSRAGRVGIDLEPVRELDVVALTELVCTPDEAAQLARLAEADRNSAFLRLWVQKEAALKAVGVGIASDAMPLIEPVDGRLRCAAGLSFAAARIELAALPMPAAYFAAVALSGAP